MKFSCHWFGISILQLVDRLVAEVKSSKQIGLLILVLDQFIFGEEFSRCVAEPLLGGIIFHYLVLEENESNMVIFSGIANSLNIDIVYINQNKSNLKLPNVKVKVDVEHKIRSLIRFIGVE